MCPRLRLKIFFALPSSCPRLRFTGKAGKKKFRASRLVLAFVAHAICQNEEKKNFSPRARAFVVHVICLDEEKKIRASRFVCALSLRASSVRVGEKKNPRFVFRCARHLSNRGNLFFRASRLLLALSLCRRYCRSKCFFGSRFASCVRVFVVQALSVRMVKKFTALCAYCLRLLSIRTDRKIKRTKPFCFTFSFAMCERFR